MTDSEIINLLRSGKREKALKELYREFPKVRRLIRNNGGSRELAQEIFNDSLILLLEKVENPSFRLTSKLSTYLVGITNFLWNNERRRSSNRPEVAWENVSNVQAADISYSEAEELQLRALEGILSSLAVRCQKILQFFYYEGCSMKEIAARLNFSSETSAKTQKFKCLEKAMELSAQSLKNQS